jgi:cytidylate kinase
MIVTIAGTPGSGKSTVSKEVAKSLKMRHFSTGDYMRTMAEEQGISLLELSKIAEASREIDEKLDSWQEALGEADDNFVIDGRLAFMFITDSIKVFLDADTDIAAERIFSDMRPEEKENTTLEATKQNIMRRRESEAQRYKKYYNIDYTDKGNFDLCIDTTGISVKDVVKKILDYIKTRI